HHHRHRHQFGVFGNYEWIWCTKFQNWLRSDTVNYKGGVTSYFCGNINQFVANFKRNDIIPTEFVGL
ncbi:hypothetical protein, partial [[Phormidium] sp. LEGE 05292]|uniref:hypothetical protein n=1 Tax=[Phormidium] sp. LEGE 05292 TaxID=767427 RepID=UPI001D14C219